MRPPDARWLALGDRIVDLDTGDVVGHGRMRPKELAFLAFLADHVDEVVSVSDLLVEVWGYAPTVVSRTVYVTAGRLRKLVEADPDRPRYLLAERPGYVLRGATWSGAPEGLQAAPERPPERLLVGRAAAVAAALQPAPVTAVVGMGGKRRLAAEVARQGVFPGGARFVDLYGVATLEAAVAAVGAVLGPAGPHSVDATAERLAALGQCLLVLEDVDDLGQELAVLVGAWRRRAPGARLLTTSRARPRVDGARVVVLGPLAREDAVELLRARLDLPADRHVSALEDLAEAVDDLPFGLEVVASNVELVGIDAVHRGLRQGLDLKWRGGGRYAGLDDVVRVAWDRLDEDLQRALTALAVFEEPVSLPAAEHVLGPAALGWVGDLVDRALMMLGEDGWFTVPRHVRAFVRRRGDVSDTVLDHLVRWALARAVAGDGVRRLLVDGQVAGIAVGEATLARVVARAEARADLTEAERAGIRRIVLASAREVGARETCVRWADQQLAVAGDRGVRSDVCAERALALGSLGRAAEAEAAWTDAIAYADEAGDPYRRAACRRGRALARSLVGDHAGSAEDAEVVFAIARDLPPPVRSLAIGLGHAVFVRLATYAGDDADAVDHAQRGSVAYREHSFGENSARNVELAGCTGLTRLGRLDLAAAWAERVLEGAEPGSPLAEAARCRVGILAHRRGDAVTALACADRGLGTSQDPFLRASLLFLAGEAALDLGDLERAAAAFRERIGLPSRSEMHEFQRRTSELRLDGLLHGFAIASRRAEVGWAASDRLLQLAWREVVASYRVGAGDLDGAAELLAGALDPAGGSPVRQEESGIVVLAAEVALRRGAHDDACAARVTQVRDRAVMLDHRAWATGFLALAEALAGGPVVELPPPRHAEPLLALHQGWLHFLATGSRDRLAQIRVSSANPARWWFVDHIKRAVGLL